VTGRLAIVQPALRLVSLVPDGELTVVELVVAPDAAILDADRILSLGGLRPAEQITIAAAASAG
jgi:hypothetical protein